MKLALGTVQFGLPYGVANVDGQVTEETAKQILECAKDAGIDTLDTAMAYGDSEQCLGDVGADGWKIITKLPSIPAECENPTVWANDKIKGSLNRLGVNSVAGLMLHRPMQLLASGGQEIWAAMQSLKDAGLATKIGFSVYGPAELEQLWPHFQPDIIQAPYNLLDQRLKTTGWLEKLYNHGVDVHVRSVFLQGLLLMNREQRPLRFNRWSSLWSDWDKWLADMQLSPLEACLGFVFAEESINRVVVGVDNLSQLRQILDSLDKKVGLVPQALQVTDLDLIDPSIFI